MNEPCVPLIGETREIQAARQGVPEALRGIYERYADTLFSTAYRITGSDTDARDVVQDVFVGLPHALERYEARGSFEGWLRRITARRSLMFLRSKRTKSEVPLDPSKDHRRVIDDPVNRVWLERAIQRLPDELRVVLVLKVIEGYSHREIARELSIAEATSMGRLCKARSRLRRWMEADA